MNAVHKMPAPETNNSDLYLMELAGRNPSLGGRAFVQEILERGPVSENIEAPQVRNPREAFASHALDHPHYRTPVEQAHWLHQQSQTMRALYEQGAELKGDILVIPAEEHELSDERETPFITTLTYALKQIDDHEQAREFHALAHAISGETADARTQITVFKAYYDRLRSDGRSARIRPESRITRDQLLAQTLAEMRMLAAEMTKLETRESVDALSLAETLAEGSIGGRLNTAARRINLREESLQLPAGLRYEQKERLVRQTLPEIDRRLEQGVRRDDLWHAIDRAMLRPDMVAYRHKLVVLTHQPSDEPPTSQVSREEYLESQRTLLHLCEQKSKHLREEQAKQIGQEWEPHAAAQNDQLEYLARRLRQGLGQNIREDQPERAAASRLFVSLSHRDAGALRLPVSSVKVYETMAKIVAGAQLSLQTWADHDGPEIRWELTAREKEERSRIGTFLKDYVAARLRDPETRALNASPVFREARAAIVTTTTPEVLGRTAAEILRVNERRSDELRQHRSAPETTPPPAIMPLTVWERNLLFNGRAPDHHTAEMRELRLSYGLSRSARAARVADLHAQSTTPSPTLQIMLQELQARTTHKAIAHFQASLINEPVSRASRVDLYALSQRIPPHERTFLYERCEERKHRLVSLPSTEKHEIAKTRTPSSASGTRPVGAIPKDSLTLRAYLANMGQLERQLLNEALIARGIELVGEKSEPRANPLTITAARALLPETLQREIRLRARNLAWQSLVPGETMAHHPLPEAVRISDTIAHLQEELQEKASLAQRAQNDFMATKMRERENASHEFAREAARQQGPESRKQFEQEVLASLSAADANQWKGLKDYAWQKREEVYRAFALLDAQYQELEFTRTPKQAHVRETQPLLPMSQPLMEKLTTQNLTHLPLMPSQGSSPNRMIESQERSVAPSHQHNILMSQVRSQPSEQIWHFDSLQEALRQKLDNLPNGLDEHAIALPPKNPHEVAPER